MSIYLHSRILSRKYSSTSEKICIPDDMFYEILPYLCPWEYSSVSKRFYELSHQIKYDMGTQLTYWSSNKNIDKAVTLLEEHIEKISRDDKSNYSTYINPNNIRYITGSKEVVNLIDFGSDASMKLRNILTSNKISVDVIAALKPRFSIRTGFILYIPKQEFVPQVVQFMLSCTIKIFSLFRGADKHIYNGYPKFPDTFISEMIFIGQLYKELRLTNVVLRHLYLYYRSHTNWTRYIDYEMYKNILDYNPEAGWIASKYADLNTKIALYNDGYDIDCSDIKIKTLHASGYSHLIPYISKHTCILQECKLSVIKECLACRPYTPTIDDLLRNRRKDVFKEYYTSDMYYNGIYNDLVEETNIEGILWVAKMNPDKDRSSLRECLGKNKKVTRVIKKVLAMK